jgi:hypothetical protein
MDVQIAKANIEHFKKLLTSETDEQKRSTLERLLAEERSKLAAALKRENEKKRR